MPNSRHQRTVSAAVPTEKAVIYAKHAAALGFGMSKLVVKALDAYIAALPPLPTAAVIAPERPYKHPLSDADDVFLSDYVQPIWERLGLRIEISPQGYPTIVSLATDGGLDSEAQLNAQREVQWACGHAGPLGNPEFMPSCRHPGDTDLLDWLEYDYATRGLTGHLKRIRAVRAHLATLP